KKKYPKHQVIGVFVAPIFHLPLIPNLKAVATRENLNIKLCTLNEFNQIISKPLTKDDFREDLDKLE
ncbi:MAG: hypothetical protein ACFFCW_49055, partial [Candidatus Hodarchaeota archaeon]